MEIIESLLVFYISGVIAAGLIWIHALINHREYWDVIIEFMINNTEVNSKKEIYSYISISILLSWFLVLLVIHNGITK